MRVTCKGQVTIPKAIRDKAGLVEGVEVEFEIDGEGARIIRKDRVRRRGGELRSRAGEAIERLRGSAQIRMSTEEIMALTRGEG